MNTERDLFMPKFVALCGSTTLFGGLWGLDTGGPIGAAVGAGAGFAAGATGGIGYMLGAGKRCEDQC